MAEYGSAEFHAIEGLCRFDVMSVVAGNDYQRYDCSVYPVLLSAGYTIFDCRHGVAESVHCLFKMYEILHD